MSYILLSDVLNVETKKLILDKLNSIRVSLDTDINDLTQSIKNQQDLILRKSVEYEELKMLYDKYIKQPKVILSIKNKIETTEIQINKEISKKEKFIEKEGNSIEAEILRDLRNISIDTSTFDENIYVLQKSIESMKNELSNIEQKKNDVRQIINGSSDIISKNKFISKELKSLDDLKEKMLNLKEKMRNIKKIQLELEMIDFYLEYSSTHMDEHQEFVENNISIRELIEKCNLHHQLDLLENSNNGRGWYSDDAIRDSCDSDCEGWYYNSNRCECQNFKDWIWEYDDKEVIDITNFTIHHGSPYGYLGQS